MPSPTPATSSGAIAVGAATVISARPCRLFSITVIPAAVASLITVFDNATASSGTLVGSVAAVANGSSVTWDFNDGVVCNKGITVTLTGTAAVGIVYYTEE